MTGDHRDRLRRQHFEQAALEFAFETTLEQQEMKEARLKRSDTELAQVTARFQYADIVNALAGVRGPHLVGAFGQGAAIGDVICFAGSYLRLVPLGGIPQPGINYLRG